MPVDWTKDDQVQAFKTKALEDGIEPIKIDEFIATKKTPGLEAAPSIAPIETSQVEPNKPLDSIPITPTIPGMETTPSIPMIEAKSEPVFKPETQQQDPTLAPPTLSTQPLTQVETQPENKTLFPSLQQQPQVEVNPVSAPSMATQTPQMAQPIPGVGPTQKTILGAGGSLGKAAGVRQGADVFSGGINRGRDVRVPNGTPLAAPEGKWVVANVYDGQKRVGRIGDGTNNGYGNSVVLVNKGTNERIRMSHLTPGIKVKQGQEITSGTPIGATGQTGNTSGPHLDIEYFDSKGKLRDIMNSSYGRSLLPS